MTQKKFPCLLVVLAVITTSNSSPILGLEDNLINVTRLEEGDSFFIKGDCGVTRCNEISGGTALSSRPPGSGPPCSCRCPPHLPLFREDLLQCVNDVPECPLVDFGDGDSVNRIPFVFIPLSGQIVNPSKNIKFQDVDNAICAVSGAQFLTRTGWNNLRDDADGDVPFSLYRDEGKTYLIWRGSDETRSRLTGRTIVTKLTCRVENRMFSPCVAFRISGSPPDIPHNISEVWFSHGELLSKNKPDIETSESNSLVSPIGLAIIFCVILALLLYGSLLLLHLRNKNKRPLLLDSESLSYKEDTLPNTKTNPLLTIETFLKDTQGSSFEGLNPRNDTTSTSSNGSDNSMENKSDQDSSKMYQELTNVTIHHQEHALMVEEKCCQMIGIVEKIPELHVAIIEAAESMQYDTHVENFMENNNSLPAGPQRKKLYFNPSFFELEYLKYPPPEAVEFLSKIREVIKIAKDKMLSKRFVPALPTIKEEDLKQEIAFPYESLSKNRSAISLKRESHRRKTYCNGCPGCTDMKFKKTYLKTMSEKEFCKECVSNEFKQNIVRMWLDEVPIVTSSDTDTLKKYRKSIAKVEGTPTSIKPESRINNFMNNKDKICINVIGENSIKRMSVPPPPPPRIKSSLTNSESTEEDYTIPQELKEKMNAVINELSKFRKIEPIMPRASSPITEVVTPFIPNKVIAITPKLVIPTPPKFAQYMKPKIMSFENKSKKNKLSDFEVDSLERHTYKRRASLSNIDFNVTKTNEAEKNHRRRMSIIAMEELEPMKKIYDMNKRLSRSFQEMSVANLAWSDELHKFNNFKKLISKEHEHKNTQLISEVYVNDTNTLSSVSDSDSSTKLLKIKYAEPLTKPGQLVIEVDGPPKKTRICDYEDFDPDTLDRKPSKLKIYQENSPPISPNKTIDKLFRKVSKTTDDTKKLKIGSLLEIFEAKNRNIISKFDEHPIEVYKAPPLPPKKVIGMKNKSITNASQNVHVSPLIKFRCTKSEPYSIMNGNWNQIPASINSDKKFMTFKNMNSDDFHSLETTYENCCNTDEVDFRYLKSKKDDTTNLKRSVRRVTKYRLRKNEQSKVNKTEDSGYLSSDSNESRHKGKFILQVRDRDDIVKEMISDTDDLDSIGDAQSESGGESIETSSVFFDSYRRLTLANKERYNEEEQVGDSGFHGESLKSDEIEKEKDIFNYRERFTSFDQLQ